MRKNNIKPYRLKHVPTGLYLDYRGHEHKLTEVGKIYTSGINGLNYDNYYQSVFCMTPTGYKSLKKSEFVKEEVKISV